MNIGPSPAVVKTGVVQGVRAIDAILHVDGVAIPNGDLAAVDAATTMIAVEQLFTRSSPPAA